LNSNGWNWKLKLGIGTSMMLPSEVPTADYAFTILQSWAMSSSQQPSNE
jgi:hypothetical protein